MNLAGPVTPTIPLSTLPAYGAASRWQEACERCKARLSAKDAAIILATPSYQHLTTAISGMEQTYKGRKTSKVLECLRPILEKIRSFSGIIDTAIQANPDVAALVWGGMKLVLELSLRTSLAIKMITDGFSEIAKALPRFEEYQAFFTSAPRLNDALVDLYILVFEFFLDSIKLFRRHPIKNIFSSLWVNHDAVAQESLQKIRRQSQVVDMESHAAKMNLDGARHEEIKELLKYNRPIPVVKLPYFQLPPSENSAFFGRVTELDRCVQALAMPKSSRTPKFFALHGIPGVGKTYIALALASREKARCQIILWLSSAEDIKLERGYVDAAAGLGLHQENASAQEDKEAVKRWLSSTTESWLLIFDNVESSIQLADYIPSSGNGSILVTSRDPESQYGRAGEGLKIEPFGIDEAHKFLLARLPFVDDSEETHLAAKTLVTQLGGLPLAIKQMADFMRETGCSIEELLTMIEDAEQHRTIRSFETSSFARMTYPNTLASALEVVLSKLDGPTLNLLAIFSMLDPDGIQDTVTKHLPATFQQFPDLFSPFHITAEYYQGLGQLRRCGLIDQHAAQKLVVVHRLVQEAAQHFLSPGRLCAIYDVTLYLIRRGHPQSQATSDTLFHSWSICSTYAPHVLQLASLQKKWNLFTTRPTDLFDVFFNCSWYLLETGAMVTALRLAQVTEPFCDTKTNHGRLQISYLYNTYGVVSLQHKDDQAAWAWFQKSLDIRKELLGDYDVNTCAVRGNQTFVLLNEKKYKDVVERLLPFRDLTSTVMADLPVRVKNPIFDQLAMAYLSLGQFDEAWFHLNISMEFSKEENLPLYSQGSAYDYYVSGNIRMAQDDLQDSLRLHTIALRIRQQVLGNHIQTAVSCYRVGDLLNHTGDQDAAITLLLQSYQMYGELSLEEAFLECGKARSAWRLASILRALGKDDEAAKYATEAEEIRVRHGGDPAEADCSEDSFNALLNYMDT